MALQEKDSTTVTQPIDYRNETCVTWLSVDLEDKELSKDVISAYVFWMDHVRVDQGVHVLQIVKSFGSLLDRHLHKL